MTPADLNSQERPRKVVGQVNTAAFVLSYDFTVPGDTSKIEFTVAVPRTLPERQRIFIKYQPKPTKLFNENGNRYAKFIFVKPKKQFKVEMNIQAEMLKYDLSTTQKNRKKRLAKGPCFEEFLKQQKYIEKDSERIQQIAKSITGETDLELVENIYNYVTDNMEYGGYAKDAEGAIKAVEKRKGDCTEYSCLFVAICRAKNIPAKVISGYITKFNITPKHNWAEVYLKDYGWVPFDPTLGDKKGRSERMEFFHTLKPIYISRNHFISDSVLNNQTYSWFTYWGDKVEAEFSIEFKQSSKLTRKNL